MNEVYKERLRETCLGGVIILLLAFGGYEAKSYSTNANQLKVIQNEASSARNSTQHLITAYNKPKYVVNAKGNLDYNAQSTIHAIQNEVDTDVTFNNGKEYAENYKQAHSYIQDPNYFKHFMKRYIDSSGDSQIDALDDKGKANKTEVYELTPGQYLVITNYFLFHNPKDFEVGEDNLPTWSSVFLMSGTSSSISHVKVLGKQLIQ